MSDGTRMRVDLRSDTEFGAYYKGTYDPELLQLTLSLLDRDGIFIDVGANIGFYSVAAAARIRSLGGSGHVIAFEPVASNFQRLLENIALNDLAGFAQAYDVGLSDHASQAIITLREDFRQGAVTGNAAIATDPAFDAGFTRLPIRLERLDDVVADVRWRAKPIGLIKMDIEGHEDLCLAGARQTLVAHRPTILMEVNKAYYAARRVDLDAVFEAKMPCDYLTFRSMGPKAVRVHSLKECADTDNVFMVPSERLRRAAYGIFSQA